MPTCTCIIDPDIGEPCYDEDYYNKTTVATRALDCDECRAPIKPGDQYRITLMHYDTWSRFNTCIDCYSIQKHMFCDVVHGGLEDCLYEYIDDCGIDDMPTACLPFLTPVARQWVCDLIQEAWDEYGDDDE